MDGLYDTDFYAWTQEQSRRLRAMAASRVNETIDWENVAEEIESMGRSERKEIKSRLEELLLHLLKLAHSPDAYPRRGWRVSIAKQRKGLAEAVIESPSLRRYPAEVLADVWPDACRQAEADLDLPENNLPSQCPWNLDSEILNTGWHPEPPNAEPNA